jgi:hypothetical protein
MARPDFIQGNGATSTGRLNFHAELKRFSAPEGEPDANAVRYQFVPPKGRTRRVDSLLLRSFTGVAVPDTSASRGGPFVSLPDPNLQAIVPDPSFIGVGQAQISARTIAALSQVASSSPAASSTCHPSRQGTVQRTARLTVIIA